MMISQQLGVRSDTAALQHATCCALIAYLLQSCECPCCPCLSACPQLSNSHTKPCMADSAGPQCVMEGVVAWGSRYGNMADATKAMQQIDGLEIANQKISVKIAALSPAETAAAAVAAAVDLDDDEGVLLSLSPINTCLRALSCCSVPFHVCWSDPEVGTQDHACGTTIQDFIGWSLGHTHVFLLLVHHGFILLYTVAHGIYLRIIVLQARMSNSACLAHSRPSIKCCRLRSLEELSPVHPPASITAIPVRQDSQPMQCQSRSTRLTPRCAYVRACR